ncbi:hypothetical protein GCM10020001_105800 [Nonomuraea salmonea]
MGPVAGEGASMGTVGTGAMTGDAGSAVPIGDVGSGVVMGTVGRGDGDGGPAGVVPGVLAHQGCRAGEVGGQDGDEQVHRVGQADGRRHAGADPVPREVPGGGFDAVGEPRVGQLAAGSAHREPGGLLGGVRQHVFCYGHRAVNAPPLRRSWCTAGTASG